MPPDGDVGYRPATIQDQEAIEALFTQELAPREPKSALIYECIANHPSQIATIKDELIGFVYCNSATPDCLEVVNLLVAAGWRNMRIGEHLLYEIEHAAKNHEYQAIVLYNSFAYKSNAKRSAATFYLRCGFGQLRVTDATTYFWKSL